MEVETIKHKGYIVKIHTDDNPEDPREWDNFGKMVCFHRRYNLGDKHDIDSANFSGWEELENYLIKEEGAVVIFPLHLYDHSGLTIKIGAFHGLSQGHARFDTMVVGFIYATADLTRKAFDVKRITKKVKERVEKALEAEVGNYDDFLRGNVYGYIVEDFQGEHIDSCWGFYGDDGEETAKEEAIAIIDHNINQQHETMATCKYREYAI